MSTERDESEEEPVVNLADLLAHSRKIEQNIEDEDAELNKQAAMNEHGLVDPTTMEGGKSPKPNAKLQNKVNELTTLLQSAEQQVTDLIALNAAKDEQIARLGEQIAAMQAEAMTADSGELKLPPAVASAKPWEQPA